MLTHTFRGKRLLAGAAVLLTALLAALIFPVQQSQAILLGNKLAITKVGTPPPATPGAREFQVVAGTGVDVVVQSQDIFSTINGQPSPLALLVDRTIVLSTTGPDAATFSYSAVLKAGTSSVTFKNVKWSTPYDGVTLTATDTSGNAESDSASGNVTESGFTVPGSTPFWGANAAGFSLSGCDATTSSPICIELTAPNSPTDQLLAFSPCDGTQQCLVKSDIFTWLVGADPGVVTRTNPYKLRVKIDKSLRDGSGIGAFNVKIQLTPDGAYFVPGLCPTSTTVGATQIMCEVSRSSAGPAADIEILFNWIEDGRGIIAK